MRSWDIVGGRVGGRGRSWEVMGGRERCARPAVRSFLVRLQPRGHRLEGRREGRGRGRRRNRRRRRERRAERAQEGLGQRAVRELRRLVASMAVVHAREPREPRRQARLARGLARLRGARRASRGLVEQGVREQGSGRGRECGGGLGGKGGGGFKGKGGSAVRGLGGKGGVGRRAWGQGALTPRSTSDARSSIERRRPLKSATPVERRRPPHGRGATSPTSVRHAGWTIGWTPPRAVVAPLPGTAPRGHAPSSNSDVVPASDAGAGTLAGQPPPSPPARSALPRASTEVRRAQPSRGASEARRLWCATRKRSERSPAGSAVSALCATSSRVSEGKAAARDASMAVSWLRATHSSTSTRLGAVAAAAWVAAAASGSVGSAVSRLREALSSSRERHLHREIGISPRRLRCSAGGGGRRREEA